MMSDDNLMAHVERERQILLDAKERGRGATICSFLKLSGPGWLQSAITLGGGSLASSLYLGVLGGFALLWLQPAAMILGVIMLCAISYVSLSTEESAFHTINKHVNPVLGWGWIIGTLMANIVWCLPQFSLGTAALQQNLLPDLLGAGSTAFPTKIYGADATGVGGTTIEWGKVVAAGGILCVCVFVVMIYETGRKGVQIFENLLKVMVAVIILCFFGVVAKMLVKDEINLMAMMKGLIPSTRIFSSPADTFAGPLGAVSDKFQGFWSDIIVDKQRKVMISAAANAVGINMTFLLPYSMRKRGWGKEFRSLAIFDLSTGLFIPFVLATSCVLIASAASFHTVPARGVLSNLDSKGKQIEMSADQLGKLQAGYMELAEARLQEEIGAEKVAAMKKADEKAKEEAAKSGIELTGKGQLAAAIETLPQADKEIAAMLVSRDAFHLATALEPLVGKKMSHIIFGIGVVSMAISSIIILMLINGFVLCEVLGLPQGGWPHRIGALMPAIVGIFGPFVWSKAAFWLAVPTSNFGMVLIPIAYFSFFMLMNSKALLKECLPKGAKRIAWNLLMGVATAIAGCASVWTVYVNLIDTKDTGGKLVFNYICLALFVGYILAAIVFQIKRMGKKNNA